MGNAGFSGQFKFAGLVIFLLTVSRLPLYSETVVRPDLSSKTINTGSVLTWEMLLSDVTEPESVTVTTLPQMDGAAFISGPVIRRNYIQQNRRSEQKGVRIVCLFRAGQPGIRKISSAVVSVENRIYRSSEHSVEVHSFYRNQSVLPPKIEWQLEKTEAYEGENVTVYLILKERRSLAMPEKISVQTLQKGSLEEVKGLCPVRRYSIADILVFDLPLAAYFYTAESIGRVALPRVSVAFEDLGVAVTPPAYIDILPLPEAVRKTNAVGDFSFSVIYEKKTLTEGSAFNVSLVLEGSGNFNRLVFPELRTENVIEVGRRNEDIWYRDGSRYSGVKRLNYRFVVERGGVPAVVSVPELYWYSVVKNQVQKSSPVNIELKTLPAVGDSVQAPVGSGVSVYSREEIRAYKEYNPFRTLWSWLIFLPGLLLLLLLPVVPVVRKKRRKKAAAAAGVVLLLFLFTSQTVPDSGSVAAESAAESAARHISGPEQPVDADSFADAAQEAFVSGKYEEALSLWGRWEETVGDNRNARLSFNLAAASAALGKQADAVYYIRKAISLSPMNSEYRKFYEKLETEYGLRYSMRPVVKVSGFVVFLFLGIGFNLFALFVFLSVVTKHRLPAVLAVACFLEIGLSLFFLTLYGYDRYEKNIILTESAALLKISDPNAAGVMTLAEGTALSVIGETEQFCLVRNNLGITGWIEKTKLRKEY